MKTADLLVRYLFEALGCRVAPIIWSASNKLPLLFTENYEFYQVELMGNIVLLMVDKKSIEQTPATIKKQLQFVQEKSAYDVIYVCEAISSFNRKRLIDQKVSFVVPGNQMYLPLLGVDFREHFRKISQKKKSISPATQVFLLYAIYQKDLQVFSPKEVSIKLSYSPTTMTRCFDELETAGIGSHETNGKDRTIRFTLKGKDLWEHVKPVLRSPVKKKILYYDELPDGGFVSGNSALAFRSMLSDGEIPVHAFSANTWKEIQREKKLGVKEKSYTETANIEIWSYSPDLFSTQNLVDPLSLYLSLQKEEDERIQRALDTMMEQLSW